MATEVEKKQAKPVSDTRSNEIVAVVLAALAILVFLCLVTYSPNDYVPFINPDSKESKNWIGIIGASVAGFLFQTVGLTALLSPFLIGLFAWRCYRAEIYYPLLGHIIGFVVFVISLSSLLEIFGFSTFFDGSFRAGGLIGYSFAELFTGFLGSIGAGILLVALLVASLLLLTKVSFATFSGNFSMAWENFQIRLGEWSSSFRLWREARNKATQAQLETRRAAQEDKAKQKTPIIQADKPLVANREKEIESLDEKFPAIFNRFDNPAKAEPKEISEKIEESEHETKEQTIPTIFVSRESLKPTITEPLDLFPKNEKSEKIPFTPIRETGELNPKVLEKAEQIEEPEIVEEPLALTKKPQNFDEYVLPETEFLNSPPPRVQIKEEEARAVARELEEKTKEFNATGRVVNICPGPVVTTYEYKPDPGVKYSRITGLSDDLCLALKAESIRIDRIPGKAFVGIEVPNRERDTIYLREVVESKKFIESKSLLTIALGKTIDGLNYVADLAKMPHLLIAGATGAGKSVGVNTLVVSILYKAKPDEVKFIMVDPKRLELGLYADIPHLATPIITDPKRAAISLKWAVSEMEKRYKDLAGWGVRNIDGFNTEVKKRNANEHFDDTGEPWKTLPYIVIIIDELADLMMVSGKEVEESITRLAQMARAVGIHLVLATQRPSVDVITGLIKANFPARISFRVSSKVDSRTIIDGNGAESLLGRGDMLFLPPATSQIIRVHGAFVDEKEIHKIVEHVKAQGKPEYDTTITKTEEEMVDSDDLPGKRDILFADALRTVVSSKRASTSLLQRHLRIGYGRAAAILDAMVREGYIGEMDGSTRARPILQKAYDDLQEAEEGREL
ncbi:MAG: DNA translocase FtsK 4TM domain-containing protein [Acidobacteriota bacterium]|jgi:S-DNA-T family DNA segregation ATPase FtsK/SpoIIIE|nr:DNA translocase FtsK 4TM domain-containing protein [Acidobacteriota bacterium]MDQ3373956.1 DNA translocase FtsK 4TM domain-containing protein [Acidobacteriota bacterium]